MTLTLNGDKAEIKDGITVAGLLENLKVEPLRVAVEVNLNIVKKCDYENHELKNGDSVEIVNFVGGG
jgi:thiamine biosynthesis protein ThiS